MVEPYFTRLCEDIYDGRFVESVVDFFGSESIAEAFFSIRAQMNTIVDEHEVELWDAEKQRQEEWTLDRVLEAADEFVLLAHKQNSPAWPALGSLAACMRSMVRSRGLAPVTHFKPSAKDDITAGFARLLVREDIRPADLLLATVACDSDPGMPLAVTATAERDACREIVEKHMKTIMGDKDDPAELGEVEAVTYAALETVRDDIEARGPKAQSE